MKEKIKISSLVILFIAVILFGNVSSLNASNLYGYICSGDSISCGTFNAIYKIFKDDLNTFYICGGDFTICNSLNAIYMVKKYDLDTYYVCSGNSIACGFLNDVYVVEVNDVNTMYVCSGDSITCGLLNDIYKVELTNNTGEDNYNNYLCPENSINQNGICTCSSGYVVDNIDKSNCIPINQYCQKVYGMNSYGLGSECYCNVGYEFNSDKTSCIKNIICSINSTKVGQNCICNEGFVPKNEQCISHTEDCRLTFGDHVIGYQGQPGLNNSNCDCEEGYIWNSLRTACVQIETVSTSITTTTTTKPVTNITKVMLEDKNQEVSISNQKIEVENTSDDELINSSTTEYQQEETTKENQQNWFTKTLGLICTFILRLFRYR